MSTILCVRESIEKQAIGTLSRMGHTSPHIVYTMSSSGCKIVVLEQIKRSLHYLEFRQKSKCLASHFYSTIGIVGRLAKKWYIIYRVYNKATQLYLKTWTYMSR